MERPILLTRKAVKRKYTKVTEARWDYLFDTELHNRRLLACRVEQDNGRTIYYERAKIERWLVEEGYYTEHDFVGPGALDILTRTSFRQHLMVG